MPPLPRSVFLSSESPINPSSASQVDPRVQPASEATLAPNPLRETRFSVWIHRILVLLFVFLCAVVGVLLVILPWRPEWTDNYFLLGSPALRSVFASGFVRGLCTGLGVLDIWIGFWEAVHYHEAH